MITRRTALVGSALLVAGSALSALADAPKPFDPAAFEAAQAEGRAVLVQVSAPWCPICKTQKPILARLSDDPRFRSFAFFDIDFDTQKNQLRRFDARMQSTLILFKGKAEVGRSVGETQAEWIEHFLEKAL